MSKFYGSEKKKSCVICIEGVYSFHSFDAAANYIHSTVYSRSGIRCLCHRMSRAQLNYAATPESVKEGYTDSVTDTFLNYHEHTRVMQQMFVTTKPAVS